ncbi:twin-arginine translocation signal domain-containing protein [Candidatus Deferrimicrobium sp.]|jgi:hypothetical protein
MAKKPIDRREFFKVSPLALAGGCLGLGTAVGN